MDKINKNSLIDNQKFAESSETIVSELALSNFTNLLGHLKENFYLSESDLELSRANLLKFTLKGYLRNAARAYLSLDCQVLLQLPCQRCLESMSYDFNFSREYLLVKAGIPDDELELLYSDDFTDDFETIEINHAMLVLDFIEEELILSLPLVPKHQSCSLNKQLQSAEEFSPFAVLRNFV